MEESFTGRDNLLTCLQGNVLGEPSCAGGTGSKGTWTPAHLRRGWGGWELARAVGSQIAYLGGLSGCARGPGAATPLASPAGWAFGALVALRVADRLGSAPQGAQGQSPASG